MISMASDGGDKTTVHVRRAISGDSQSLAWIVARLTPLLIAQAHYRLGTKLRTRYEPEDIVQDSFAVALETIGKFTWRGEESFYRWLASIAEHLIWSSSQKKAWDEISLTSDFAARGVSPSVNARRDERFERLKKALESLSLEHRQVCAGSGHDRLVKMVGHRSRSPISAG